MKKLETFSVRFMTRASKNTQNSNDRLYARITVAGERTEVSLGQDILPGIFDQSAQRCLKSLKEARLANVFLETVKYKLNEYRKELMLDGKEITADSLKRKYMGIPLSDEVHRPTILELYDLHNTKLKELISIDIAHATYKRHMTSKSHVATFIKYQYVYLSHY